LPRPRAILGLILAGGQSTRMGVEKAFVPLDGRPLIAHAVELLRPQVQALAISANGDARRFAAFGLPVLPDAALESGAGPLAGVAAGLADAARQGCDFVATAPCDAPFAPTDFVSRLAEAMADSPAAAALAESPRGLEPLFALWRVDLLAALRAHLAGGGRSPRDFLIAQGAARARFAAGAPFANLNSPADLARARAKAKPS
jgi:molybdopterin-guanine dinucleotide biosynthesis protein A